MGPAASATTRVRPGYLLHGWACAWLAALLLAACPWGATARGQAGLAAGPTGWRLTGRTPAPSTDPSPSGPVTIRTFIERDWGSGFVARIEITNDRGPLIRDWTLGFDFRRQIAGIGNTRVLTQSGIRYRLGLKGNRTLAPGAVATLRFVGAPGNVAAGPSRFVFHGGAVLRSLKVTAGRASAAVGGTIRHWATGTYSDGSTHDLTTEASWSSSTLAVAKVHNAPGTHGTALGIAPGTAVIQARHPATGLRGSVTLTVTAHPSLPGPGKPVVFGYVETLRSGGAADIPKLDYDDVDVVIHGFAVPRADATLDTSQGNFANYLAHGIVGEVHQHGKRILASVGGAVGSANFAAIAADPNLRAALGANLAQLVQTYGYDGVDIDDEFPTSAQQGRNFTLLMQAVASAVKAGDPTRTVTFGASPGYYIDSYEWSALGTIADYALVFGYDWKNPANGPMTNPGIFQWTAQNHRIEASVRGALDFALGSGFPAGKLVAALPFYGSNNVPWLQVRDAWAARAPMTPHPQGMEVQLAGAWFTSPECIAAKMHAVLSSPQSVLAGRDVLGGVGFWEFGHEAPAHPDLSQAIGNWIRAHPTASRQQSPYSSPRLLARYFARASGVMKR